jgi:hypothetical protein
MKPCPQEILDAWQRGLDTYATEIESGFMKPQLCRVTIDMMPADEIEFWTDAVVAARLSADGYLDCTEWIPIFSRYDVEYFFRTYVE